MSEISDQFMTHEELLRAVWPPEIKNMFWNGDRIAPAAFIDPRGLSVDRTYDRTIEESVQHMRNNKMQGYIVSVKYLLCQEIKARVLYKPTSNTYHSEIHGEEDIVLSDEQALILSRNANICFNPNQKEPEVKYIT